MTIATPPMPWQTVRELLAARAERHGDRVALIAESRCAGEVSISYARMLETANRIGNALAGFGIELHGDHDTIMRASKAAKEYVQWASELQRVECPVKDLWVSCKCGESDTTSGCGRAIRGSPRR